MLGFWKMKRAAGSWSKKKRKRRSKKLIKNKLRSSVVSNNDLLSEILLRLPVISLVLFKSVSKRWLSLIKDTNFTLCRSRIPKLEPPSGLFMNFYSSDYSVSHSYDFVPFDTRIPICRSSLLDTTFTFGPNVEILQSCNGLLLCHKLSKEIIFVYNPSISNMFKVIPKPNNVSFSYTSIVGGTILAFDPTKSPHYKVIHGEITHDRVGFWIQMHIYSSETGNWSVCRDQFDFFSFTCFMDGVYWNDAIHWLNVVGGSNLHFKLHKLNEHPILTTLHIPLTLDGRLYDERKLFESGGCLLFVGKDDTHSRQFTIYEMRNGRTGIVNGQ